MISVIIPTLNEALFIGRAIAEIRRKDTQGMVKEIIVMDGGSTDATVEIARKTGVITNVCKEKGRAVQMNAGAALASSGILYFMHADAIPPEDFAALIVATVGQRVQAGCFRLQFDHTHWFLRANAWFTRFNLNIFRFGDQSLFISKYSFEVLGGFDERKILLEDQDIVARIRQKFTFKVLPQKIVTSARKYLLHGIFRTQFIYYFIYALYRCGASQKRLGHFYERLVIEKKK